MSFLSAADDFCSRTLASLNGTLTTLTYIAGLRSSHGHYSHWGLERTHGPDATQEAIATNHSQAWLEVLRAPMSQLVDEVEQLDMAKREELLAQLSAHVPPQQLRGGTARHFNSIVLALQLVFRASSGRKAA